MLVKDIAYINFEGDAGGPVVAKAIGVVAARTAAGVYTLTLDTAVDDSNVSYSMDVGIDDGSVGRTFVINSTSDTVKQLNVYTDAGVASDAFIARILVQSVSGGGVGGG